MLLKKWDRKLFVKDLVRVWSNPYQTILVRIWSNPYQMSKSFTKSLRSPFFSNIAAFKKFRLLHYSPKSLLVFFIAKVCTGRLAEKYWATAKSTERDRTRRGYFFVIIFLEFPVPTYLRRERWSCANYRSINLSQKHVCWWFSNLPNISGAENHFIQHLRHFLPPEIWTDRCWLSIFLWDGRSNTQ